MPLIAIESQDNIGKTTLINSIKDLQLPDTQFLNFPNENTESGRLARRILNNKTPLSNNVLQAAFIVNFYEVFEVLQKYKFSPHFLILDRYYFSTIAYTRASSTTSNSILNLLTELPKPDLLVYLDGETRVSSVEDKHGQDTSYQDKIKEQYKWMFYTTSHQTIYNNSTPGNMTTQFINIMANTFKTFKYFNNI